jgi:ribosomal protein L37E
MRCKRCNTENNNENKFCVNCGFELHNNKPADTIFCPSCGAVNDKSASFCSACGYNLSNVKSSFSRKEKGKRNPKRRSRRQPEALKFSAILKEHKLITTAVIILMVFLIYQSVPHSNEIRNMKYSPTGVESSIAGVMSDSVTSAVVKNFICACGECTDPLDVCTCTTAAEERGFIQTKAAQNMSVEGIITAVKNKYGGMKPASELNFGG